MALKWYVVHVYSGFENKVQKSLEDRIASSGCAEKFGEVIVPTEQVVELVKGKKKESSRKFYPGYILVQMELDDETWHVVANTAKVTGFLGGKNKPAPITDQEADKILERIEAGKLKPQPKYSFEVGDEVRVTEGPFATFSGLVETVNQEKGKLRVLVSIFGRSTPVELDFMQVAKL
ncbi:transcription termination/antitermination protein NusG [Desulfosudis oleivorans]|uniref:Transcription termination/antitermination protein NusG n=1 Tax=Desulfosudis oleivorans (strain DSM 6200 / JCM 39069 / Hxd3) TaxID=96561 RepID=A8ZUU4_DESOH|nr:transcription termination/antitermination protein NusG [Desulfosudis oleivorans]ABW66507.1 NusG antitermination factor [Desulfosudis oleivorans Hxd3]